MIKSLFKCWSADSETKYSLKNSLEVLDAKLLKIKPPSFIQIAARSIKQLKNWRSKEFMVFILFYALVVFCQIMDFDHYQNMVSLVVALEYLFTVKINKNHLAHVNQLLIDFLSSLEKLYASHMLKSGVRELLHLKESVLDFGPLYNISLFQFEE